MLVDFQKINFGVNIKWNCVPSILSSYFLVVYNVTIMTCNPPITYFILIKKYL